VSLTRIGVVGLGLIGGSIARRLAEMPDLYDPIGFDTQPRPRGGMAQATSIEELARDTELVIVAVPPERTAAVIAAVLAADQDVLVTDVASVKKPIVAELGPGRRYLPSHPLAGSETTGWLAARADLLHGTTWAVCPPAPDAPAELFCRWADVFDAFDARLIVCDPDDHDRAVARTSHVPHLVATVMAASLARQPTPRFNAALSGGSFREVARVASSDPALWSKIVELNGQNVKAALEELREALGEPAAWKESREMAALVRQLRWEPLTWEQREFDWPAWDELLALGRDGVAIRHPRVEEGGRISAEVAIAS
jgi:prephenate dehydrogenase